MKKNKIVRWVITVLIILILAGALGYLFLTLSQQRAEEEQRQQNLQQEETPYTQQDFAMDTLIVQSIYGDLGEEAAAANKTLLDDLENKLSMYKQDSEISQVNAKAGLTEVRRLEVSDDTYNLLVRGKELGEQTQGLFDITIGPLSRLWNITGENPQVPSEDEITKTLSYVDYTQLSFDDSNHSVRLQKPFMQIDLGGIAKGYACDKIKASMAEQGVTSATVSLGGNVLVIGKKPNGEDFSVGIRDPFGGDNDIMGTLAAPDKILATTGAYERYFEQDGKVYHHVLDPRTGYPCETELASVTVISEDGTLADCLSTTFYIAGKQAVLDNLNNYEEFALIAIDQDKNVYISDSLKDSFTLSEGKGYTLAEGNA